MIASKSTTLKAFAALILLSVLWGYNWVVMKYALLDAGPFQFGALRTFLGALCLMGILLVLKKTNAPERSANAYFAGDTSNLWVYGLDYLGAGAWRRR